MSESTPETKKERMPTGMYVGSLLIGLAIFGLMCWIVSFIAVNAYVREGVGDVANFVTILILIPIFGFALPMGLGIRTLRRAGREAQRRAAAAEEKGAG